MKQNVLKHRCSSFLLWANSSLVSTAECRFACCDQQDVNRRWCFLVNWPPCVVYLLGPAVGNRKSPQHFLVVCCHQQDVYRRWCPSSFQLPFLQSACFRFACCHQQDVNRRWCFLVNWPPYVVYPGLRSTMKYHAYLRYLGDGCCSNVRQ